MDKKQEIIFATYDLFSEKGYNLSISEIAKKVNLRQSSIYTHFKGKDEIISLMIEQALNYYYDYLEEKIKLTENKKSSEEKLKFIYLSILGFYNDISIIKFRANILGISNENIKSKTCKLLEELEKKVYIKISRFFEEGIENKEISTDNLEGIFHLYIFMIQGIVDSIVFYPEANENRENYITKTWNAFWNGISTKK